MPGLKPRICVIGAGPSGITAGKNLIALGLDNLVIFDRNSAVGGNWIFDRKGSHSSIYETTSTISSRRLSQYDGFPMPRDYPDYPDHRSLLRYFQRYAEHFGVTGRIRFATEVVNARPRPQGGWSVTSSGPDGGRTEEFDDLLVANGHHWDPRMPDYPGTYSGRYLHSHAYKAAAPFAGERVLVIGGGNTASDIAVETARVSRRTCLSMRRGYYFFPKFIFGQPIDVVYKRLRFLPRPAFQALAAAYLRLTQGGNEALGLQRPDHRPLEHHPTLNAEIVRAIRRKEVHPRPDIARFDGRTVHFVDGGSEEFDVVVAATGYRISFPFFASDQVEFSRTGRPSLHLFVFHPTRRDLFFIGLVQPIGCIWSLADLQAQLVARDILGHWPRPSDWRAAIARDEEHPHFRWSASPRHSVEVDYHAYRQRLLHELAACR